MAVTCWLVGERNLLVSCGDVLLERGYRIAGVSTPNPQIRRWAEERGVPVRGTARAEELRQVLGSTRLDFLFSISNEELLSAEALALAERGTVNFHDGPLPRYAGVHSTTWAVLNREPAHGISWHRMTAGVDDGPVLARRELAIDPGETAFSLNLKAFQAGLESFPEVLDALLRDAPGVAQDFGVRTLYRRFQRPPFAMVIDWTSPAEDIDAFCRGLDFGPHPNPFGTAKLMAHSPGSAGASFFIVPGVEVLNSDSGLPPGSLVDVSAKGLTVATGTRDVRIRRLLTLDGTPVDLADLAARWPSGMRFGMQELEQAGSLSSAYTQAARNESFFVDRLTRLVPAPLPEPAGPRKAESGTGFLVIHTAEETRRLVRDGRAAVAAFAAFWRRWATREPFRLAVNPGPADSGWSEGSVLFSSWLPLAVDSSGEEPVGEFLGSLTRQLESLQDRGPFARDVSFRYPALRDVDITGRVLCKVEPDPSNFELPGNAVLALAVAGDGSSMRFFYDRSAFPEEEAKRAARRFGRFLSNVAARPDLALANVSLIDEAERRLVVKEWNDTLTYYPLEKTVPDLFVEQVRKRPGAKAVAFEGRSLTYQELNERAASLAARLAEEGVVAGSLVAVFLDRGIELAVALLGILKAGGAYVPLDPAYPAERIAMILDDTGAPLVVTDGNLGSRLPSGTHRLVMLESGGGREDFLFAHPNVRPENPAYVICTSGSTGRPKAVPVRHKSVTNLLLGVAEKTGFTHTDSLLAISSVSFDLSVFDFFLPLVTGGWLEVLSSEVTHDGVLFREKVEVSEMTYLQATPGTWRLLLAGGWTKKLPVTIVTAGEALSRELADQVLARVDRLFSGYGPTETTVLSSLEEVHPGTHITLGLPLPNYRHYVLDDRLNPVGEGEPGEICIGGVSVSPGYLNRPEETASRFLEDPFVPGEPLYRSGDMGRFLPSGRVEFLGRADLQIKLRGYRIELGDVESALLRESTVRDAVVALRRDPEGGERLVAFVVLSEETRSEFSSRALLQKLADRLPEYMVPADARCLERLPFTANNKVDRKLLSTWEISRIEAEFGRPSSPVESKSADATAEPLHTEPRGENGSPGNAVLTRLASVAAEVLGARENLDPRAHIIDLGFDSIRLAAFAAGIERALSIRVPVTALYQHPTLEQLAAHLGSEPPAVNAPSPLVKVKKSESLPSREPIAVIGMAGRFPGAPNVDSFWTNLIAGVCSISTVRRFLAEGHWGGFLEDIDLFEPVFFGISPRDATLMDPQQRLLLETAWHALEDAGLKPSALAGRRVGVFTGIAAPEYASVLHAAGQDLAAYPITGISTSLAANRLSYVFDFQGPSEAIDTGCSSSLLALHRAVTSLVNHECELALAGGVNLILGPDRFQAQAAQGILSPDGKVRPFDRDANGLVRGEGVGLVVLKRLSEAERDGDFIHGLILGSAAGHGGRTTSLSAPNPAAQAGVIREALRQAGLPPGAVSYIESHGTGTPVNDPLEMGAYLDVFGAPNSGSCPVGSLKPNIGHLEAAAGIASLVKVLLAFRRQKLPATLNFQYLNPAIDLSDSPLSVLTETVEWSREPRVAAVHGFGFGGTCGHIVVSEYFFPERQVREASNPEIFVFSAKSNVSLDASARDALSLLARPDAPALPDIAATLRLGREELDERLAIVARDRRELASLLAAYLEGSPRPEVFRQNARRDSSLAAHFDRDPDAAELIATWVAKGRLGKVADLWTHGVRIDWERLLGDHTGRRVPLGYGYPFNRARFWPEARDAEPGTRSVAEPPVPGPSRELATLVASVLGMPVREIEPGEDLQKYGLDSLAAVRLLNRIETSLGQKLSLAAVYADPTIRGLSALLASGPEVEEPFPLSAVQRLFWDVEKLAPGGYSSNCPAAFRLPADVDLTVLEKAFGELALRHPVLRTGLREDRAEPVQFTRRRFQIPIDIQDVAGLSEEEVVARVRADGQGPFDLTGGPLFRVSVFRAERPVLLFTLHHIITDALTLEILLKDLVDCYSRIREGRSLQAPVELTPYRDFVSSQERLLAGPDGQRLRAAWKALLPSGLPALPLPLDRPRLGVSKHRGETVFIEAGEELFSRATAVAAAEGVTPSSVWLSALHLLLHRHTEENGVAVAVPVSGRGADFEQATGLFMNVVPVVVDISGDPSVRTLRRRVHEALTTAVDGARLPLPAILTEARAAAGFLPAPPLSVAFYDLAWKKSTYGSAGEGRLTLEVIPEILQEGERDLTLELTRYFGRVRLNFKYDPDLFDALTVRSLARQYLQLIEGSLAAPAALASSLSLLDGQERQQILQTWNDTRRDFPLHRRVHELFDEQARTRPDAIAAVTREETLTYGELARRSDELALRLERQGAGPESLVGVLVERSANLLVALLGVLKTGAAYVPLDPGFPSQRLAFMVSDSGLSAVVTSLSSKRLSDLASSFEVKLVDVAAPEPADPGNAKRAASTGLGHGLAYVIYTSGSTGQPKGTRVLHRSLTNLLLSMAEQPGFSGRDQLLAVTTISFDIAALELFLPLVTGGVVEVAPAEETRDGARLRRSIELGGSTVIQATPATFRMLIAAGWRRTRPLKVLCGGEPLPPDLAERLLEISAELWNVYGPTETTVWSTAGRVLPGERVTVGRPIANTAIYILDGSGAPVAPGIAGELAIGGAGVAEGYHARPDLTRTVFVRDPFGSPVSGQRMYLTGDRARFLPDGRIELLGRRDSQVKLRGVRIELGEVESALRRVSGVSDAVAVLRPDKTGQNQLFAFVVPSDPGLDVNAACVQSLTRWLPAAMLPSAYVSLGSLPLTPNRKLDRRALATRSLEDLKTEFGGMQKTPAIEPPDHSASLEQTLAGIVGGLVNEEPGRIDPLRNLGEYGLDSVRFTALAAELTRRFETPVEATLFYERTTLRRLAQHFLSLQGTSMTPARNESKPRGNNRPEPVAIVGIGGVFPGAVTLDQLWGNLWNGTDLISEIPPERWQASAFYGAEGEAQKTDSRWGGFVPDVDSFDAAFFGISPREAETMDPQQRLLLRAAWRAFEHAGHRPSAFAGTRTGVFAGASGFDFEEVTFSRGARITAHTLSGLSHAILANRISYLFDLRGPSATIDTACSSSLVALHRAVVSIQRGECRAALAGGVSVILSPLSYVALSQTRMLSPEGRCKAFDSEANGYVRGEGAVLLLLRPLSDALADGDTIHGVILGSAENHGGRTHSLTAPSPEAQADLIVEAHTAAGVDPRTVTYMEAHGTGTSLGDPIEINGLKAAFATLHEKWGLKSPEEPTCGVGSVKTNFGHLEAAAGVAGVVKVVLSMQHGRLPGLLHNAAVNPLIHLEGSPLFLVRENRDWNRLQSEDGRPVPRRAGVSSFGFGGANAHVVLEEFIESEKAEEAGSPVPALFPISAADRPRLVLQCRDLAAFVGREAAGLAGNEREARTLLNNIAFTLQTGREAREERVAIVAESLGELRDALLSAADSLSLPGTPSRVLGAGRPAGPEESFSDLARRWTEGGTVDWTALPSARMRRIPLPGHPFEDVRYRLGPATAPRAASTETASPVRGAAEAPPRPAAAKLLLKPLGVSQKAVSGPDDLDRLDVDIRPAASMRQVEARATAGAASGILPLAPGDRGEGGPAGPGEGSLFRRSRGEGKKGPISTAPGLTRLKEELASVLYADAAKLDENRPFVDLGVDSILTVEFARQVEKVTGRSFKATDLYDHPTLAQLAAFLAESEDETPQTPAEPEVVPPPATSSVVQAPPRPIVPTGGDLLAELTEMLARVLYTEPSHLSRARAFVDLGVDSILGVEFIRELNGRMGLDLSASTLYDHTTLEALARHVQGLLPATPEPSSLPSAGVTVEGAARESQDQASRAVAIIGCSGRFPGANNVREFWRNLAAGVCSISEVPSERWDAARFFDPNPGRPGTTMSKWGGFLTGVDRFDPLFFNISPSDAELMDPQQRLFLEETWRAVEDAGYSAEKLAGSPTGVWAGVTGSDHYRDRLDGSRPAQEMLGNAHSILAGRVSYALDLRGPAIAIDTACSSSLVAMHMACQSLLAGETDLAIAGGVTLYLTEDPYIEMSKAGMLALDGKCKTFDDRADGFVPGEGAGVVILKRFDEAVADGDHVYAVIRGSGLNQDGRTNGLTAPSARSQADLETRVYRQAGIDPETITLVEAHGTGTKLGDPIEVEALTKSFRQWTDRKQFCALGSVKTNIGHTTAAAGVASVIKVLMALAHRELPPSLHCEQENRHLKLSESPFFVNTRLREWRSEPGVPRRAAVSSFGFSGTNSHLVLEEAPVLVPPEALGGPHLILLSAKTRGSLASRISELSSWLSGEGRNTRLCDVAFTLSCGRAHFPLRVAFVVSGREPLREELTRLGSPGAMDAALARNKSASMKSGDAAEASRIVSELASAAPSSETLRQKLALLADLYTRGADFDLGPYFQGKGTRRLPLPAYSFERERCWAAKGGPLPALASPLSPGGAERAEVTLQKVFRRSDPLVRDHEVSGQTIVPGTALLAAVVEAFLEERKKRRSWDFFVPEGAVRLTGVVWLRPVVVEGAEAAVWIRLTENGPRSIRFEIGSSDAVLHAEGNIEPPSGTAIPDTNLEALTARVGESLTGEALYSELERAGVRYGPALRGLALLHPGKDEALGTLRSDVPVAEGLFPAAALDSALQTTAVLTRNGEGHLRPMMPFGLDEVVVIRPVPPGARAHVSRIGDGRFDAVVTDRTGSVCIAVRGLTLREPRKTTARDGDLFKTVATTPLPSMNLEEWQRLDAARSELDRLARRLAVEPLLRLGVLRPGTAEPVDGWRERSGILPAYLPLVSTVLGLSRPKKDLLLNSISLPQEPLSGPHGHPLPVHRGEGKEKDELSSMVYLAGKEHSSGLSPGEVESVRERFPELRGRLDLLARCVDALPDVVTGRKTAVEVLFPSGSPQLVESVYQGDGVAELSNQAVASLVVRFVKERNHRNPGERLDILEVGAGTGATTRAILDALTPLGASIRYVFSDVSPAFVRRASSSFFRFPFVEGAVLDLERDPAEQGFPRGSFDIVLGTNVVHATARLRRTLGFLRCLLRAGGIALVSEATRLDDFAVLTFGLTPGWWGFEDPENRIPGSPLVASERWMGLFSGEFGRVHDATASHALLSRSGQTILVAGAGLEAAETVRGGDAAATEQDAVRYLKGLLSRVLKIDQERLSEDANFDVYGLDSLGVLDVNRELEKDFGRLPSTLLFEHLTIRALAGYLGAKHAETLARLSGTAPARSVPRVLASSRVPNSHSSASAVPLAPAERDEAALGIFEESAGRARDEIAIVGVAGRYPLGATLDEVWDTLKAGKSAIRLVPEDRWDWKAEGPDAPRWGGFIRDVDRFDSLYFGISPREAAAMDPQERLFLETAAALLEDAGLTRRDLASLNSEVGVFVGAMAGDYEWLAADAMASGLVTDAHASYWSIANRVSYFFDLKGPSLAVDTACSSSLTAIHLACESLRRGECQLAIAGGVNLILHPVHFRRLSRAGMLSQDERCKSFGAGADGFVDGEGVGAVLLKPLSRARLDGDRIWTVIKGSAINAGGRTSGFTVPNPVAQGEVVARALRSAGVDPRTVTYVEAHGTGTSLGDPIEIAGLSRAFGDGEGGAGWCAIGSAKSNAGHLEAAAGVLGLTKVLLQMSRGMLVPSLHAAVLNPQIDFEASPFRVQRTLSAWESGAVPRRAGVSSFGAGGANAHLVVEEYNPPQAEDPEHAEGPELIVLSARDRDRLRERVRSLASFLSRREKEGRLVSDGLSLGNIAFTLQTGREAMAERLAFVAGSTADLVTQLEQIAAGKDPRGVLRGGARSGAGQPSLLSGDDDVAELLDRWIAKGKLSKLAELWTGGAEIDFRRMPRVGPRRRVSLPAYPFARVRHWIGRSPATAEKSPVVARVAAPAESRTQQLLYVPFWERRGIAPAPSGEDGGTTLVLLPGEKGAEELAGQLAAAQPGARTIVVRLGRETRVEEGVREVCAADPGALVTALEGELHDVRRVYHLGALERTASALDDLGALESSQQAGVLSLFRLVKELRNRGQQPVDILVATGGVHRVAQTGSEVRPFAGCLSGFVRSLGREYSGWRARCIDLDSRWLVEDPRLLAASLRAELYAQGVEDVTLRNGRRLVRTLVPLEVPQPGTYAFRERGAVLILGGGGGLGLELATHLASVRARLILVGRKELDAGRRARIEEIERRGAEVLYVQADASRPGSLDAAVARGREKFGPIQAAVHSAIVLADRTIDRMDEATLLSALAPKVTGSVALFRALRSEPLDFLLFFSSAESFSGDAGQSNYSAASTFKDAFASALAGVASYPVKTVNWGYWGEAGVVATDEYRKRLTARGVHSLSTADGMATVSWLLAESRVEQVLAIRAEDEPLSRMGVDLSRRAVACGPAPVSWSLPPSLLDAGETPDAEGAEARLRFESALQEVERLGRELLVATLRGMGVPLHAGARFEAGTVARNLGIVPARRQLLDALFSMLERQGWLEAREDVFTGLPALEEIGRDPEAISGSLEAFGRKVREVEPQCVLLKECLASYPEVLTGRIQPTEVLFPGGSMDRVSGIYRDHPVAEATNRFTARCVRELCVSREGGGPIRILEAGAGTGGTTVSILKELAGVPGVEYVYTDISRSFLQHGRSVFEKGFPFITFRELDVERDPVEQGFPMAHHGVVVASNVLHATRDLGKTLRRIKTLLAPGGWLVLNEAVEAEDFLTLTFGLLDGWWLAEDPENRITWSPLATAAQWRRVLEEEGFETFPLERCGEGRVIVAQSDGLVRFSGREPVPVPAPVVVSEPRAVTVPSGIVASPVADVARGVKDAVVSSLAAVLELDPSQIDDATPFSEIGIDSLLAAEVINRVNDRLGTGLRATDVYSYPTVEQLVERIRVEGGVTLDTGAPGEPARREESPVEEAEDERLRSLLKRLSEGELSVSEAEQLLERA